jgi:hypothetical protein
MILGESSDFYLTILMADKLSSGLEPVWWVQPVGRTPNTWS